MVKKENYIFVDLDGTLLNDEKMVCDRNKRAINQALNEGHHVIVATGRPIQSAIIGAKNVGLDCSGCYILAYNGGLIYDCTTKKVLYEKCLEREITTKLFEDARDCGLHIQAYCQGKVWCEADTEEVRKYHKSGSMPYEVHKNVPEEMTEETQKCIVISFQHDELVRFRDEKSDYYQGKADSIFSTPEYLEYLPVGISKGNGIRKMAELLNFDMDQTIAIGDEENDISMIEAANLGVAMANATDKVKKAANYVTTSDNNQGGVAEVIETFVLS